MENIHWPDNLKLGIKEIDEHHEILFKYISQLLENCSKDLTNPDPEQIRNNITQIRNFAVKHFHAEERLMKEFNYPFYPEHKDKHKEIIKKLMNNKLKANHYKINRNILIEFSEIMTDWFLNQTLADDLKLADFLKHEVGLGRKLLLKLKEFF